MTKKCLMVVAWMSLLMACSEQTITPKQSSALVFRCSSGAMFKIEFEGDTATLEMDNDSYSLSGERSASGATYSNELMTFWGKGENAILMINNTTWQCHSSD
ncbi:MliC family protein [Pseudoalteromonas sp. SSDWG2]|uniref:MliC family protein n=1 Tax=Pseudoalteromonas sp. SSDWG2 TaxID=3139391 RepID=UPI003BABED89